MPKKHSIKTKCDSSSGVRNSIQFIKTLLGTPERGSNQEKALIEGQIRRRLSLAAIKAKVEH